MTKTKKSIFIFFFLFLSPVFIIGNDENKKEETILPLASEGGEVEVEACCSIENNTILEYDRRNQR